MPEETKFSIDGITVGTVDSISIDMNPLDNKTFSTSDINIEFPPETIENFKKSLDTILIGFTIINNSICGIEENELRSKTELPCYENLVYAITGNEDKEKAKNLEDICNKVAACGHDPSCIIDLLCGGLRDEQQPVININRNRKKEESRLPRHLRNGWMRWIIPPYMGCKMTGFIHQRDINVSII